MQLINKNQIISELKEEFSRWVNIPKGMSNDEITERRLPGALSIKDVYAHLMAWQQRTIARLEAAVDDHEPRYPAWPDNLDPDGEGETLEAINAWIHATHRDRPWEDVYRDWHTGFSRFIALAERVPEADLMEKDRYSWLQEYALADVVISSYEHHHEEHLGPLQEWLSNHFEIK